MQGKRTNSNITAVHIKGRSPIEKENKIMLKIDEIYKIYATSPKKAIKGLIDHGFIEERDIEELGITYRALVEVDIVDGWLVYLHFDESEANAEHFSFFQLYELFTYPYKHYDPYCVFIPICRRYNGVLRLLGYVH